MSRANFHFVTIFLLLISFPLMGQQMEASVIDNVTKSVFEVLVKRPVEGVLSYDRELPARSESALFDDYLPLGTAFYIGDGQFVSAAHLFSPENGSLMGEYCLKAFDNTLYSIAMITKFSDYRDFILFTVDGFTSSNFLEINTRFELNKTVFAVGNALGDGIVIRDGLLTSVTPERVSGRWDWLRFTAAASPGNSGGPLVDQQGRVVGIISMKSLNENLNFALPIGELLDSPDNIASFDKYVKYSIPIFNNYSKGGYFRTQIKLPLSYLDFHLKSKKKFSEWNSSFVSKAQEELKEKDFPNGLGAKDIIYGVYDTTFPGVIAQKRDNNWTIFHPQSIEHSDLEDGSSVEYGEMGDFSVALFNYSDNIEQSRLFSDSKYFMDLFLKGVPYYRDIAGESYRITSFGMAENSFKSIDKYGRKWIVSDWILDYTDIKVLTYTLPLPSGAVVLIRAASSDLIENYFRPNFKMIADHLYITYSGSFNSWRNFLSMRELLPSIFKSFNFSWTQKRLQTYLPDISLDGYISKMEWNSDSTIKVMMSFEPVGDKLKWVPADYSFSENRIGGGVIRLSKFLPPTSQTPKELSQIWGQIKGAQYPYDGRVISVGGSTKISRVVKNIEDDSIYLLTVSNPIPDNGAVVVPAISDLVSILQKDYRYVALAPGPKWQGDSGIKAELEDTSVVDTEVISDTEVVPDTDILYFGDDEEDDIVDQLLKDFNVHRGDDESLRPWSDY